MMEASFSVGILYVVEANLDLVQEETGSSLNYLMIVIAQIHIADESIGV